MKSGFKKLILISMLWGALFLSLVFIPSREEDTRSVVTKTSVSLTGTIRKVMPSVVFIKGYREDTWPFYGSGFIVSDNAIMTAGHCIPDDLVKMEIFTVTGRQFLAKSWVSDPNLDCGIVSVWGDLPEGTTLKIAKYGDYSVGDDCFAVGNPYSTPFVVTKGIVGAIGISIPLFGEPLIMTDFIADPGCSGGPVFNMQGKVIGIVVGYRGSGTVVVPILSAIEELNGRQ